MAILIREKTLEEPLERHALGAPVPTTKAQLLRAMARTLIMVADAEGVNVGRILDELNDRSATRVRRRAS